MRLDAKYLSIRMDPKALESKLTFTVYAPETVHQFVIEIEGDVKNINKKNTCIPNPVKETTASVKAASVICRFYLTYCSYCCDMEYGLGLTVSKNNIVN